MHNIGITGVGGGVGQSIIKSLQATKYKLIALNSDPLGAGLYAAQKAFLIPLAASSFYIEYLVRICKKEKISILFPGMDAELMKLAQHKEKFKQIGTDVIVSSEDIITIANDKLKTYSRLKALGFNVPKTILLSSFELLQDQTFPLIIKQRIDGARSRNVFHVKNVNEYLTLTEKLANEKGDYIVQEYIDGTEYTCGSINLEGECKGVIVMRRILRDGDTYKCYTESNKEIEEFVRDILNAIKPYGACNIQLRVKKGVPYVIEINARCSGTTAARSLCGFNEPKMIADYLLHDLAPAYVIKEKTILRYWQELVVPNDEISQLSRDRNMDSLSTKKL